MMSCKKPFVRDLSLKGSKDPELPEFKRTGCPQGIGYRRGCPRGTGFPGGRRWKRRGTVAARGIHYVGKGTILGDNAQGERDGVAWMVHR